MRTGWSRAETAVTQETYWAGDSVWIYSMSWLLHSRHVRRLLYIQKFVQQIVQNTKSGNIEKECEKRFSQTVLSSIEQHCYSLFQSLISRLVVCVCVTAVKSTHAYRNTHRQHLEISVFSTTSVVLWRQTSYWGRNLCADGPLVDALRTQQWTKTSRAPVVGTTEPPVSEP